MTKRLELLRILREQLERLRVDAEDLFVTVDKLYEYVSLQYDIEVKREAEREMQRRRLTTGVRRYESY